MILLTPGPCMTSESVRQAAAMPDLNHREPEYAELFREVRERLVRVYDETADWHPYLIGGSGTAAVEAMITSCIGNGRSLILENGYYSARLREIFDAHKMPYDALTFGWLEPISLSRVANALETQAYEAVLCTHNETTTGRLNDIAALGALAKQHRAKFLVDAMSSFGADPIDFEHVDALCSSANKCLHGIPGVSFVLATLTMATRMRNIGRRTYYLSLPLYEGEHPPMTPPVPAMAALRQALREMPNDRPKRYAETATWLRTELQKRGFIPAIPTEETSSTLTTYQAPTGWTATQWIASNRDQGYLLYACKGELADTHFQVSIMGELTKQHLAAWLEVVDRLLTTTT